MAKSKTKAAPPTKGTAKVSKEQTVHAEMLAELQRGKAGVKRWNERLASLQTNQRDFRGTSLAGLKLAGINLENLDLQRADFTNADLSGARLVECDLRKACFKGAKLDKALAWNARLTDADFTGASLRRAELPPNCLRAIFRDADLTKAALNYSNVIGADFTGATLAETELDQAKFDESTRWPADFACPAGLRWVGKGENPAIARAVTELQAGGSVDLPTFLERLKERVDQAKYDKALAMLKADRFKLFAQVEPDSVIGVVKSQTDPELVYSCRLAGDGKFACCTQNLNVCGGLRGALCKHLLVLIIGLANSGELDPTTVNVWVEASRLRKPELDKDRMSEAFLRFKGAEAGDVDWRPTETIPEDYYAL
jgi:hypothetical protein